MGSESWLRRCLDKSWSAALAAAGLTLLLHVLVMVMRRIYPFGPFVRGQGDYLTQYLAFHAEFRRALLGDPLTDLQFTWASGSGVPFFGDITNYVGGPFPFILALVPEHLVELGLTAMVLLQAAVAGAAMAVLLRMLAPGSNTILAALFGSLYACSAWVFEVSIYTPQWMNGLIAFPVLCLVAMASLRGRHLALSCVAVAVTLWSNYYTAYMAIIGAVLFYVVWALGRATPWRQALAGLARFAVRGVVGAALAAFAILPTALILKGSTGSPAPLLNAYPKDLLALRFLPGTSGVAAAPAFFVGSIVLLLAVSLVASTASTLRDRLFWWGSLGILVVASTRLPSVMLIWSAFVSPHGSPYRFVFVIVGWILICAWKALWSEEGFHWPRLSQVALASVVLALLFALLPHTFVPNDIAKADALLYIPKDRVYISPDLLIYPALALGCMALMTVGGFISGGGAWATWVNQLLRVGSRRGNAVRIAAATAVLLLTLDEVLLTAGFIDEANRDFLASSERHVITSRESVPAARAVTAASQWPLYRAGNPKPFREPFFFHVNVAARDRFPGVAYSSSMMPSETSEAYARLGMRYASAGRMLDDQSGSVADAIFAVAARYDYETATMTSSPALPLVRTYTSPAKQTDSVFGTRENLLPHPIYRPAEVSAETASGTPLGLDVNRSGSKEVTEVVISASCPQGDVLSIDSYAFKDMYVDVEGSDLTLRRDYHSSTGIQEYPAAEPTVLRLRAAPAALPTSASFRCHDSAELLSGVESMEVPQIEASGSRIRAIFDTPQSGDVTVATAATPGWRCTLDDVEVPAGQRQGFLSVKATGQRELSCQYTQPGLHAGIAASALASLLLAGFCITRWLLARRPATPRHGTPEPSEHSTPPDEGDTGIAQQIGVEEERHHAGGGGHQPEPRS